ncbi:class I SAM-dependent DNA methyltransferase [Yoonia sp. 208BN28-4]|uniref:class I SAM-dependent DNA methyltransferase n=1 Tax=Yoonia sp. 208BN28-4 TaxID=3126505 RepID=UPI00309BB9F0
MTQNPDLDRAYAMQTRDEAKALYENWAPSYDIGFAEQQGYQLAREVALAFVGAGGAGPVLDVGAGTGLVATHLEGLNIGPIDGLDLSGKMLAVAKIKGHYANLIEADVTKPLPEAQTYSGIVSAGTFTLGHVGPEGVLSLLDAAQSNALMVISVNLAHFESAGFAKLLEDLSDRISDLTFKDVRIYDDRADAAHRDDVARLMIFRVT